MVMQGNKNTILLEINRKRLISKRTKHIKACHFLLRTQSSGKRVNQYLLDREDGNTFCDRVNFQEWSPPSLIFCSSTTISKPYSVLKPMKLS